MAAFYRNTAIHVFVDRAIGEVALLAASESDDGEFAAVAEAEALRLRELLKFDFFFAGRHQFGEDIDAELRVGATAAAVATGPPTRPSCARGSPRRKPHVAHLVLRPFLDAYHVVADRLAALDVRRTRSSASSTTASRSASSGRCRAGSPATSRSPWSCSAPRCGWPRTAGCSTSDTPDLAKMRRAFAEEIALATARIETIADFQRAARA